MELLRPDASGRWAPQAYQTAMSLLLVLVAACGGGGGGSNGSSPTIVDGGSVNPPTLVETKPIIQLITVQSTGAEELLLPADLPRDPPVTNDTRVTMNGEPVELADLRAGDLAIARGTVRYEDGYPVTDLHFDSIEAYQLVAGPVDSVDAAHGRLAVLGQQVSVTSETTIEGEAGDVPVVDGGLTTVEPGRIVAVSGHLTASGEIIATRLARHGSEDGVLLRGIVGSISSGGDVLTVGGVEVGYWQARLQDFPAGHPAIGDQILVLADSAATRAPLEPHTVRFLPRTLDAPANTLVRLDGVITRFVAADDFDIDGLAVGLECDELPHCPSPAALPRLNGRLWIQGSLDAQGVVRIQSWNGFIDLVSLSAAPITAIDAQTGALTVYGFQVQPSAITRFRDGANIIAVDELHDGALQVGDIVTASGDYGGVPGLMLATTIYRQEPDSIGEQDSISLYGERFELASPAIIVLGRPIMTNSTTPVVRCGQPSDTVSLFSSHPDTVMIDLPADPLEPPEAMRVFFRDDAPPCPT
jgi:hypothetical protein